MVDDDPSDGAGARRAVILSILICGLVVLAGYVSLSYLASPSTNPGRSASLEWGRESYAVSLINCSHLPIVDLKLPPPSVVALGSSYGLVLTVWNHGMLCPPDAASALPSAVVGVVVVYQPYPGLENVQPTAISPTFGTNCVSELDGSATYDLSGVAAPSAPGHFVVTLKVTVAPCS